MRTSRDQSANDSRAEDYSSALSCPLLRPWTLTKFWYVLSTPLAAVLVVAAYVIVRRVLTDEFNHWAVDIRVLVMPALMLLFLSVFGFAGRRALRVPAVAFGVLAILTTALIVVLDRWNVLVDYEAWIDRGMPGRWMP